MRKFGSCLDGGDRRGDRTMISGAGAVRSRVEPGPGSRPFRRLGVGRPDGPV
jgi:hypothetical protein